MAKIGTAHVEIKPVLNEDALDEIAQRIEETVAHAVERGMARPVSFVEMLPPQTGHNLRHYGQAGHTMGSGCQCQPTPIAHIHLGSDSDIRH